eukprot:gene28293-37224_t
MSSDSILALDFDGVICASSTESSVSSILAAKKKWPTLPLNVTTSGSTSNDKATTSNANMDFNVVKAIVNGVRPIIETGYENILVVRYCVERLKAYRDESKDTISQEDLSGWSSALTSQILQSWNPQFRDKLLSEYECRKDELIALFGATRDEMIRENMDNWISLNGLYPTVAETLQSISQKYTQSETLLHSNLFIVTTKQERFVKAILEKNAIHIINSNGIPNSAVASSTTTTPSTFSNIFDLDNVYGSKIKVLLELTNRIMAANSNENSPRKSSIPAIHFVEDRFETLINVLEHDGLEHVQLYLADWGYNTEQQKEAVRNHVVDSLKKLRMALSALMAVTVMEIVEIIAVIVGWVGMVMTVEQLLPREAIILFQF